MGKPGVAGPAGAAGKDGKDGKDGKPGLNGVPGPAGQVVSSDELLEFFASVVLDGTAVCLAVPVEAIALVRVFAAWQSGQGWQKRT